MANPLPHFFNILVAPGETLTKRREQTQFVYPFLAVLLSQALVILIYFQVVDFAWLTEYMATALPADMSPRARESAAEFNQQMGPMAMSIGGVVSVVIMFSLLWALSAGYLTLVSSLRSEDINFKQWFGLECWAAVPMLLVALASLLTILLNPDGQLGQDKLNPFTLNNLLFHRSLNESGVNLLSSIDLSLIWAAAIKTIGYRVWTKSKTVTAAAIVVTPYVVIFGAWALVSFT